MLAKRPDPSKIISAAVVLLAVAVWRLLPHAIGHKVLGPSMDKNMPLVIFVCSMPLQWSASVRKHSLSSSGGSPICPCKVYPFDPYR